VVFPGRSTLPKDIVDKSHSSFSLAARGGPGSTPALVVWVRDDSMMLAAVRLSFDGKRAVEAVFLRRVLSFRRRSLAPCVVRGGRPRSNECGR
jgi:hypothetical protein